MDEKGNGTFPITYTVKNICGIELVLNGQIP